MIVAVNNRVIGSDKLIIIFKIFQFSYLNTSFPNWKIVIREEVTVNNIITSIYFKSIIPLCCSHQLDPKNPVIMSNAYIKGKPSSTALIGSNKKWPV